MVDKIIEFQATGKLVLDAFPRPRSVLSAKSPSWYADTSSYLYGMKHSDGKNFTIKKCMPVFDAMTAGYYMYPMCDLSFGIDNSIPMYNESGSLNDYRWVKWTDPSLNAFDAHTSLQIEKYPKSSDFYHIPYKFMNPWVIKTAPGYSCLFIHPMHIDNNNFWSMPAIVDTDLYPQAINFPFFIKKDFEGVIEHTTPIIQVIPIKRNSWKAQFSMVDEFNYTTTRAKMFQKIENAYRTLWREKKTYR